jgi:hypothetical protein
MTVCRMVCLPPSRRRFGGQGRRTLRLITACSMVRFAEWSD